MTEERRCTELSLAQTEFEKHAQRVLSINGWNRTKLEAAEQAQFWRERLEVLGAAQGRSEWS